MIRSAATPAPARSIRVWFETCGVPDMTEQAINAASPAAKKKMSKTQKVLGCVCAVTVAGFIGWLTYDGAPARKGRDRQIRADAVGEIGNPFVPIPKTEAPPA